MNSTNIKNFFYIKIIHVTVCGDSLLKGPPVRLAGWVPPIFPDRNLLGLL